MIFKRLHFSLLLLLSFGLISPLFAQNKHKIDSLRNTINPNNNKKIFFQIGAKPLYSVVKNTYMDDYIKFLNCNNIFSDLNSGTVTRESVIQRNPDIIFIVTMGIVGNEEINLWSNYKRINAVKNNKIFVLNSDIACSPTPMFFVDTFKDMVKNIE